MDRIKVLYVDDERDLLEIAKFYLEKDPLIKVDTCNDAREVLERIVNDSIDIIVSDYQMPKMSGLDLLGSLRNGNNDIPFILFTGKGREEVAINALNLGATFYLQKGTDMPVQYAELKKFIVEAVSRHRAENALIKSEWRYHSLLKSLPLAYSLHQATVDENGDMVDYSIIDINRSFELMTGLERETTVGKSISDIMPLEAKKWIDLYNDVVKNGRTTSFQSWSDHLGRWYDVLAYRNEPDQFVTVFQDITNSVQKNQEAEQFAEVVNLMKLGLMIFHLEKEDDQRSLRLVATNDSARKFLGRNETELKGRLIGELLPVHKWPEMTRDLAEVARTGGNLEWKNLRFDNGPDVEWFDGTVFALPKNHVAIISENVTKSIETEDERKRIGKFLSSFLDNSPSHCFIFDLEGKIIRANRSASDYLGSTNEALIGTSFLGVMEGQDQKAWTKNFKEVLETSSSRSFEDCVCPSGKKLHYQTNVFPMLDDSGKVFAIGVEREDITIRLEAEEEAARAEKRFQAYFENDLVGIVALSPNGKWLDANDRFCSMLGLSKKELFNRTTYETSYPDDLPQEEGLAKELVNGERDRYSLFKRFFKADGSLLHAKVTVQALRGPKNELEYLLAMVEDVGWGHQASLALKESQERYRSLFLSLNEGLAFVKVVRTDDGNMDFEFLDVNIVFEKVTELSRNEIIGRTSAEIWGTGTIRIEEKLLAVSKTGTPYSDELFFAPLGKYLRVSVHRLSPDQLTIAFRDITDQIRAERKNERQAMSDDLVRRTYMALADAKPNQAKKTIQTCLGIIGNELEVDRCTFIIIGHGKKEHSMLEWTRRNYGEKFRKDYIKEFEGMDWLKGKLLSEGAVSIVNLSRVPMEARTERMFWADRGINSICSVAVKKDGKLQAILELHAMGREHDWVDEEIKALNSLSRSFSNLFEKAELEAQLQKNNDRLNEALKVGALGSMTIDIRTGKMEWSEEMRAMFGLGSNDEPSIDTILQKVVDEDRQIITDMFEKMQNTPSEEELELRLPGKSGMMLYYHIHFMPVRTGEEEEVSIIGTCLDITNERMMKEQLRAANTKVSLLMSVTRHDILNQIGKMNASIDMNMQGIDSPQLIKIADKLSAGLTKIEQMIRFTRDYKSLGGTDPTWQRLQDLVVEARSGVELNNVIIDMKLDDLELRVDPLFSKVVFNLLDNSIRHGQKVKKISIWNRVDEDDSLIVIYEDDGVGIPLDDKEMIFMPGFGKNTGFGLYLAREILEISKISIKEDGGPGEGARFQLRIPKSAYRINMV